MKTMFRKPILWLTLLVVGLLSGCIAFGAPLNADEQAKIDQQIRESVEKTFPLPGQVVIRTHVGDDLRFSTGLSVEEVTAFYRNAYTIKGYVEGAGGLVSAENATLLFQKEDEKDVTLDVMRNENGSDVHIQLGSPTP